MNNANTYSMSEQDMEHIAELMEKHRLGIIHSRRQGLARLHCPALCCN